MATKHDQNRAEKRERLLRSAVEAFTEAGFENATVSDVVHRAEMTPSTFYNYYRDKDALRDDLVAQAGAQMTRGLAEIRTKGGGVQDYVSAVCRGLFHSLVEEGATNRLLRRNLPLLRSLVDDRTLGAVYAALRTDLAAAAAKDGVPSVHAEYATAVMRSVSVEISVQLLSSDTPDVEAAVAFVTRVMVAALSGA